MRIMLTNDDGYRSAGINALFKALLAAKHDVIIVAPEVNSSGASQSIAVYSPITITKVNDSMYFVSSTPTDSVRLGLQVAYKRITNYPELVISGINVGENIGEDVLYSGTVGAAREATMHGIPALACSSSGLKGEYLDDAAKVIIDLVTKLDKNRKLLKSPFLWNINIPDRPYAEISGFEATELGKLKHHKPLVKQITPRGDIIYWQGESGDVDENESISTDTALSIKANMVSITPLGILPTDYNQMPVINALIM